MPIMICFTVATGVTSGAAAAAVVGVAARAVRSPAMMNPMPLMNSSRLMPKSQLTVFMLPLSTTFQSKRSSYLRGNVFAPVKGPFIQDRQQDQCQGRGAGQAADDHRGERPLYVRARGGRDRHRDEADAGDQRRHQYGPQAARRPAQHGITGGPPERTQAVNRAD